MRRSHFSLKISTKTERKFLTEIYLTMIHPNKMHLRTTTGDSGESQKALRSHSGTTLLSNIFHILRQISN